MSPVDLLLHGDAVSATVALQKEALTLGWAITASVNTLRSITGAVRIDRRALVELPGRRQGRWPAGQEPDPADHLVV